MTNAGNDLTRVNLTAGMEQVGQIPMSTMGDGSFGPGKHDAADELRINRWAADCRCWKPASAFRRTTH